MKIKNISLHTIAAVAIAGFGLSACGSDSDSPLENTPDTGSDVDTGSGTGEDALGGSAADTDSMSAEICDNGVDDDADGLVDCADEACEGSAECLPAHCPTDTVDDARGFFFEAPVGPVVGELGCNYRFYFTTGLASHMIEWTPSVTGTYEFALASDAFCLGLGVYAGACDGEPVHCSAAYNSALIGSQTFVAGTPYVFGAYGCEEGDSDTDGLLFVSARLVEPGDEACNNGLDDDSNGLIDCDDPACADGYAVCRLPQ